MEELKKLLSEKYLGMGEYFKQTFSLMTKIAQKESATLGAIVLVQIATGFLGQNPISYLMPILNGILSVFLLQRIISYIEGDDDGYANLNGISNNNNLKKIVIAGLMIGLPLIGVVAIIFLIVYPYFLQVYVNKDFDWKGAYEYSSRISTNNRLRIILPGILIAIITFIPMVIIMSISIVAFPQFKEIVSTLLATVFSLVLSLFSGILFAIIYLNVKYMDEENSGSYDNRNITDENAIDYNKDK